MSPSFMFSLQDFKKAEVNWDFFYISMIRPKILSD